MPRVHAILSIPYSHNGGGGGDAGVRGGAPFTGADENKRPRKGWKVKVHGCAVCARTRQPAESRTNERLSTCQLVVNEPTSRLETAATAIGIFRSSSFLPLLPLAVPPASPFSPAIAGKYLSRASYCFSKLSNDVEVRSIEREWKYFLARNSDIRACCSFISKLRE